MKKSLFQSYLFPVIFSMYVLQIYFDQRKIYFSCIKIKDFQTRLLSCAWKKSSFQSLWTKEIKMFWHTILKGFFKRPILILALMRERKLFRSTRKYREALESNVGGPLEELNKIFSESYIHSFIVFMYCSYLLISSCYCFLAKIVFVHLFLPWSYFSGVERGYESGCLLSKT